MSATSKDKEPRHVRLYHWVMNTEAWHDLDTVARCAYIEIVRRYGGPGSNNGRIPCSLLEIAKALHIGKATAMRALAALQDHGFIVLAKQGGFNMKRRHSSEWLLTEFKEDTKTTLALPGKDFARWKKLERGFTSEPHRVPKRNRAGSTVKQLPKGTAPYGFISEPVSDNHGFIPEPLVVYQGEASASARSSVPSVARPAPLVEEAASEAHHNASAPPPLQSTTIDLSPSRRTTPEESGSRRGPVEISEALSALLAKTGTGRRG